MASYSKDLRVRAVAAVERGIPRREVVEIFSISPTTLKRWLRMRRERKDLSPGVSTGRRRRILSTLEEKRLLCGQLRYEPSLKRGQIILMDNLSVHKSRWVIYLIEESGCELWLLPSYSPDFNPIEEDFSKVKGILRKARTLEALFAVTAQALRAVSAGEARGYFEHCGYRTPQGHSL